MKSIIILLSSLVFLSHAQGTNQDEITKAHTEKMQKRLLKLSVLLETKEQEREQKSMLRDLRLRKLDASLKEKAKKRG